MVGNFFRIITLSYDQILSKKKKKRGLKCECIYRYQYVFL